MPITNSVILNTAERSLLHLHPLLPSPTCVHILLGLWKITTVSLSHQKKFICFCFISLNIQSVKSQVYNWVLCFLEPQHHIVDPVHITRAGLSGLCLHPVREDTKGLEETAVGSTPTMVFRSDSNQTWAHSVSSAAH